MSPCRALTGDTSTTSPSTNSRLLSGASGMSHSSSAVIRCCLTLISQLPCLDLSCMIRHSQPGVDSTGFRGPVNQSSNMPVSEANRRINRNEERRYRSGPRPCPRLGCQQIVDPGQRAPASSTIDRRRFQRRIELTTRQLHRAMEIWQIEDTGERGTVFIGPGASPHQVVMLGELIEPLLSLIHISEP